MTEPFTIYITQSAHTDIGYTHPQDQIRWMYLDFYEKALELCRRSEKDPEAYRFKWVYETAWQVRHFVENRPELEEEFQKYVRNGQLEITAGYLHFTDLIDVEAYDRSLDWVTDYCAKNHLPLNVLMHADINGWPWGVADILAKRGIQYFVSHVHIDSATNPLGPRGSVHYQWLLKAGFGDFLKPDTKIRIPQAFWWQGPQGGKVLHWFNEHYHLGNFLGLSGVFHFPGVKKSSYYYDTDRDPAEKLAEIARMEVPAYIRRLKEEGYPYSILVINTSGFFTDNGAPDDRWCQIIRDWDETASGIRLRTATMTEWFQALEKETNVAQLPVRQSAWPDHWAHGLGSEAASVSLARRNQRRRASVMNWVDQMGDARAKSYLEKALESERLSLEHTFDAWSTSHRPSSPLNVFEQVIKQTTFYNTDLQIDEAIDATLRAKFAREDKPGLYVFADLEQPQTSLVNTSLVQFDAVDFDMDPARHKLVDGQGRAYDFQLDDLSIPKYTAVLPLGAGLNHFRLEPMAGKPAAVPVEGGELASKAWKIKLTRSNSGLASLVDLASGSEWVDAQHQNGFGELIHEQVVHPLRHQAVGNIARMIALGIVQEPYTNRMGAGPVVRRTSAEWRQAPQVLQGAVFDTLRQRGALPHGGEVQVDWRLYHALPVVEMNVEWHKDWSELPEALYITFPFQAPGGRVFLENGGGFFEPGNHGTGGQIPGTVSSYYTVQRAARIQPAQGADLFWLPLDAPLVLTNEARFDRWESDPYAWNGVLASMPVNHYWHTNFAASQRGILKFRYRWISAAGFKDGEEAIRAACAVETFGWR